MAAGYRPFCLSCCMRSAEAMTGHGAVGEGMSEGVEGIRVTMAGKENARCCGIEIGHGDMGVEVCRSWLFSACSGGVG